MNIKRLIHPELLIMFVLASITFVYSCKEKEDLPETIIPELSFNDFSLIEGTGSDKMASIVFTLSEFSNDTVLFKWSLIDNSAKLDEDYVSDTTGIISFLPGQVSKKLSVTIKADSDFELDENFMLVVSDLVNLTTKKYTATITIENDDESTIEKDAEGYITPIEYPGMTLVWSDEFDGASINLDNWTHELGKSGWGNNEWQDYTNLSANSYIENGKLVIKATSNYGNYYSARMITKGKKEFTYGRIDIRAKMPEGKGIWPALWMLGGNISSAGWPKCGEIDIMEFLGHDTMTVYGTAHYDESGHQFKGSNLRCKTGEAYNHMFHVFSIVWEENSISWYIDNFKYLTLTKNDIVFDAFRKPQFFIFNVAVGGNWPGYPDQTTVFPQKMIVDYVRVFQ
jgi:hypothetical protein